MDSSLSTLKCLRLKLIFYTRQSSFLLNDFDVEMDIYLIGRKSIKILATNNVN